MFGLYYVGAGQEPLAVKDDDGNAVTFDDGRAAAEAAKDYAATPPYTKCQPRPLAGKDDDNWMQREMLRLVRGEYQGVDAFNINNLVCRSVLADGDYCPKTNTFTVNLRAYWPESQVWWHFPHVSQDDPEKIAYTESEEKGRRDIQTRIKIGRYLQKYFGDRLSQEEMDAIVARHMYLHSPVTLKLATEPDDIERVYRTGPRSCMAGAADCFAGNFHPARVYGAGDLAIAYIEDQTGRPTARCVVWPAKKKFSRFYGDEMRLKPLLQKDGYSYSSDFNGARLLRVPYDSGVFHAPYLDCGCSATDNGEYLVIQTGGEIDCQMTNGLTAPHHVCDNCENTCDPEYTVYIAGIEQTWCDDCASEYASVCEYYGDYYRDDDGIRTADGVFYSNRAVVRGHVAVTLCDECDEYHHDCNIVGITNTGGPVCHSCASDMHYCEDCAEYCAEPCECSNDDDENANAEAA